MMPEEMIFPYCGIPIWITSEFMQKQVKIMPMMCFAMILKRSNYPDVILPFTVLRRIDCVLSPTKEQVLKKI